MRRYPAVVHLHERRPGALGSYLVKLLLLPAMRFWRRRLGRRVIFVGITGSAGKTTAKRLLHAVLATAAPTRSNIRTGNRTRSLARTFLTTTPRHRFCVQEVGAFGPGTMDEVLWPLEPDVAVLTNAGWDHLSALGGPDGAAEEKGKLVEALPRDGLAVLNADDARVRALAGRAPGRRVVLYGVADEAQVRAADVGVDGSGFLRFTLLSRSARIPITTRLAGEHWLGPALAALATGIALGVEPAAAAAAVAATDPEPHRLSRMETNGVTFLQDDWKASSWTVEPALLALDGTPALRRVAVLGQLSDDPLKPRRLYARTAALARRHADLVVLVGEWANHGLRARAGPEDSSIVAFHTAAEAHSYLRDELRPGDAVLIKASRQRDHLERLSLAHVTQVRCWVSACDKQMFCEECRLLSRPRR